MVKFFLKPAQNILSNLKREKEKKILLALSFFFFFSFGAFTYIVKTDALTTFDQKSIVKIQSLVPRWLDVYLSILSIIGTFEILTVAMILLFLFLRKHFLVFLSLAVSFFLHIIEIIGKRYLTQPPPPYEFFRFNLPFHFPSAEFKPGFSYPSGHSMRTVFLSVILAYIILKSKRIDLYEKAFLLFLLLSFNFAMLISRVSLGEHWTTDVIGGTLLGIAGGLLVTLAI